MKSYLIKKEHPLVTVDIVIFTLDEGKLKTILVKRGYEPYKNQWALPGGFIGRGETCLAAAHRELKEETGIGRVFYLEQLYTFDGIRRDPRGRVITVSYLVLVPRSSMKLKSSGDAKGAKLFAVGSVPDLAFDHRKILEYALHRLRNKIDYTNIVWSLLPPSFTLSELQKVYETIWGKGVDKRNFRKKILSLGLLRSVPKKKGGLRQRPAQLYRFKTQKYQELKRFF